MTVARMRTRIVVALPILAALGGFPTLRAQTAHAHPAPPQPPADSIHMAEMGDHAMSGAMDENEMRHMELSPLRPPTHADSVRAMEVAAQLKRAIARYQDTAAAAADGYRMFLPNVKDQKVFHFTNYARGFKEAFRFDPAQPTSILYRRGTDGKLHLIGAMYTMPKNAKLDRLDARVPLSIARWHKHVNWCVPRLRDSGRWSETRNGAPVFGPGSPIATKADCDAVGGQFHPSLLGWMIHANVYEGDDLATVWGDEHHGGDHHAPDHDHHP
jgi:hypothetical protein